MIRYVVKYSGELSHSDIRDSLDVFNTTFCDCKNEMYFEWKYLTNPQGGSLHIIGYDGDEPVLSRVFWRMDVNGHQAYQPVDTAVKPPYQGRGLFRETCRIGLDKLEGFYIYNYPNSQSRPGYLKNGWSVRHTHGIGFSMAGHVLSKYVDMDCIDNQLLQWRFKNHPYRKYHFIEHQGKCYLLSERQRNCFAVLGRIKDPTGLVNVRPKVLFTYDQLAVPFHIPGKVVQFLDNNRYQLEAGTLHAYLFDML